MGNRRKNETVFEVARLVGPALTVLEPRNGWPSLVALERDGTQNLVALHVGQVIPTHRGRDELERRIQNPASLALVEPIGTAPPMIIGLWDQDRLLGALQHPILVAYDAVRHMSSKPSRVSLFVPLQLLVEGGRSGWCQGENSAGERIAVFWPSMMPVFAEMFLQGESVDVSAAVDAAGASSAPGSAAIERARKVTSALVRDRRFSRGLRDAYGGFCAVCGLNSGLVVGAHVLPVAAGGADHLANGVALCANHHAAFDSHLLWIDPDLRTLNWHPMLLVPPPSPLLSMVGGSLREPLSSADRPSADAFRKRYSHFTDAYPWVPVPRPRSWRAPVTG